MSISIGCEVWVILNIPLLFSTVCEYFVHSQKCHARFIKHLAPLLFKKNFFVSAPFPSNLNNPSVHILMQTSQRVSWPPTKWKLKYVLGDKNQTFFYAVYILFLHFLKQNVSWINTIGFHKVWLYQNFLHIPKEACRSEYTKGFLLGTNVESCLKFWKKIEWFCVTCCWYQSFQFKKISSVKVLQWKHCKIYNMGIFASSKAQNKDLCFFSPKESNIKYASSSLQ